METKINEAQLVEAVTRYFHGEKLKDIAKDFDISSSHLSALRFKLQRILRGRLARQVCLSIETGVSVDEVIESVYRGINWASRHPSERKRLEELYLENTEKGEQA